MSANLAALLYLASGVLFILALRGLSSPASSRQGNMFGMIGMTIAVLTTLGLAQPTWYSWILILAGLGIGGFIVARDQTRVANGADAVQVGVVDIMAIARGDSW